jgi:hypothetical protein
MPAERTTMRHGHEVVQLNFVGGVPTREIARWIFVCAVKVTRRERPQFLVHPIRRYGYR